MTRYIPLAKRAEILSIINDGMPIVDAAKTFSISESTIYNWMTKQTKAEAERLHQDNQALRIIIGQLIYDREKAMQILARDVGFD